MTDKIPSSRAAQSLEQLGANIRVARLKRRFSIKDFAVRMGVSEGTVMRLEKGDAGVGIGTLAMACLVLGEVDRISDFLDMGSDDTGLLLDMERLPRRIDKKRKAASATGPDKSPGLPGHDDTGVAF